MHRKKSVFTFNISSLAPHLPFIVFTALLLIGVLLGSIFVGRTDSLATLASSRVANIIGFRRDFVFLNVLKDSLSVILPAYIATFLFGTSVIGCVTSPVFVAAFGFYYGCVSGYVYMSYRLEGIMFCALILIPFTVCAAFGLILLARESFAFSYALAGICIMNNRPVNIYATFKNYCVKCLVSFVAIPVAIIFDMGMSALFVSFFSF